MKRRMPLPRWTALILTSAVCMVQAQESFTLTSPAFKDGGTLPADLKCTRDGGEGLSPPLNWISTPDNTKGLAIVMHHYPRGTSVGVDAPSQYWLLWNIPADSTGLERGNSSSIGTEGSDKDGRQTGYTSPCSPSGQQHEYVITVYALNATLESLPITDSLAVDWSTIMGAMQGKIIDSSQIKFIN